MARRTRTLTYEAVGSLLDAPAGAYVHVPFCASICPFCPYNKVIPRPGQAERYASALLREVRGYREAGLPGEGGFSSLYVGGGTPTLVPELLAAIVAEVPVQGERAVEVLPDPAAGRLLDTLREVGFTAVSVGVQSFSDDVLRHLRRPHDGRAAESTLAAALERFALVDADLILDVEYDDGHAGSFLRDLTRCLDLGVHQVSTYPLMRFGFTPFGKGGHQRRREHDVLAEATRLARERGYERRSVWTFNRPDSPSYSSITRRRFVGLGAGAASFLGRDFLANHFGVETYVSAVAAGRPPVARWLHLGRPGGVAYDAFWQAYAGRRGLTGRGLDLFHDLERAVTYRLIEPLWAQLLAEHAREGGRAGWAAPASSSGGLTWRLASALLERPLSVQPVFCSPAAAPFMVSSTTVRQRAASASSAAAAWPCSIRRARICMCDKASM